MLPRGFGLFDLADFANQRFVRPRNPACALRYV
jgi:hypothetical protein